MDLVIAEDTLQEELEARYRALFARNNPKPVPTRQEVLVRALSRLDSPPWCFGSSEMKIKTQRLSRTSMAAREVLIGG